MKLSDKAKIQITWWGTALMVGLNLAATVKILFFL